MALRGCFRSGTVFFIGLKCSNLPKTAEGTLSVFLPVVLGGFGVVLGVFTY